MHPNNKHQSRYDFEQLTATCPALAPFVFINKYESETIDFSDPMAVKMLNKALLQHHYQISFWDIPPGYLCPPIPGRADYLHHIAAVLAESNKGKIPKGKTVKCLDLGMGANCIYPILGHQIYGWSFIGSDIDKVAIHAANKLIESNPSLKGNIEIRWQENPTHFFRDILKESERIDLSICNPPFHASKKEAEAGSRRKVSNLKGKKINKPILNFGGQSNELWCKGGALRFIENMILESKDFASQCSWFSTLVSKEVNLKHYYKKLKEVKALKVKTIPMSQGHKISRILAWSFQK